MRRSIGIIAIAAALGAGFLWYAGSRYEIGRVAETPLKKAPGLALKTFAGDTKSVSDFRGKPVLINFWATWCPYCKSELSDFVTLKREYGDRVEIMAVNRGESREVAERYVAQFGSSTPIVFLLDTDDAFYREIGGFSMPETLWVDAEGFIRFHRRGPMTHEEMKRRLEDLFGL